MRIKHKHSANNHIFCGCDHPYNGHAPGGGKCKCNDAYGSPCECVLFVELRDIYDDYADEP